MILPDLGGFLEGLCCLTLTLGGFLEGLCLDLELCRALRVFPYGTWRWDTGGINYYHICSLSM